MYQSRNSLCHSSNALFKISINCSATRLTLNSFYTPLNWLIKLVNFPLWNLLPFFKCSCYFFFLNTWRVALWSLIDEKPYILYDFNVGDWLGLETSFKPRKARNISVSKLYSVICCRKLRFTWASVHLKIDYGVLFMLFWRILRKQGTLTFQKHRTSLLISLLPMNPQNITEIKLTIVYHN